MKVYLLNPPFVENFVRCGRWQGVAARGGTMDYPKWLAYTAVHLYKDYEIKLVDAPASKKSREEIFDDVKDFHPDVIVIETNFSSMSNDATIASELKEVCGAVTIMVGPPVCQYYERLLSNSGVDIVVWYEYDFIVKKIIDALTNCESISTIPSISYKDDNRIITNKPALYTTNEELESLDFVSKIYKQYLNIDDYFLSQSLYPEVQIFTGRGCPFHCTFCSWPENLMGRKYRSRSAKNIVDELEYICNELPQVKEVFIEDDTFTINKKLVMDVCHGIIDRKLKLVWSCQSRANLDYETLVAMKKAGCRLLIVGYESANENILETIRKGETKLQMMNFTNDVRKAGIMIQADFIFGLPGETKETMTETTDFIHKMKPNLLQLAVATPIPGTAFYNWAKENGYLLIDDIEQSIDENGFQKAIISYPNLTADEIQSGVNAALKGYYMNFGFVCVAFRNVLRKNGWYEFKNMWKSMTSFLKYIK